MEQIPPLYTDIPPAGGAAGVRVLWKLWDDMVTLGWGACPNGQPEALPGLHTYRATFKISSPFFPVPLKKVAFDQGPGISAFHEAGTSACNWWFSLFLTTHPPTHSGLMGLESWGCVQPH